MAMHAASAGVFTGSATVAASGAATTETGSAAAVLDVIGVLGALGAGAEAVTVGGSATTEAPELPVLVPSAPPTAMPTMMADPPSRGMPMNSQRRRLVRADTTSGSSGWTLIQQTVQ
jgi:hypothetical protein